MKLRIRNYIGLVLAAAVFAACQSDTYYIKGEAKDFADGTLLYLTTATEEQRVMDSIVVRDGWFAYYGTMGADEALLCRLRPAEQPKAGLTFFVEPGNIYVELSSKVGASRVSGTKVNNEWQALNDTVTKYDRKLCQLFATDSVNPRKMFAETEKLHTTLTRRINEAAKRNQDNALGRFISSHYPQ